MELYFQLFEVAWCAVYKHGRKENHTYYTEFVYKEVLEVHRVRLDRGHTPLRKTSDRTSKLL